MKTRTKSLSSTEKANFFNDDLKYRMTMLLSWKTRYAQPEKYELLPREDQICGYEAASIACRMFLQFLGLGVGHKSSLHLKRKRAYFMSGKKTDEVKVIDLGGRFVVIKNDLTTNERKLLARAFHASSKATAHLTAGSKHRFDWKTLPVAIDIVTRLLDVCLYQPMKKKIETA